MSHRPGPRSSRPKRALMRAFSTYVVPVSSGQPSASSGSIVQPGSSCSSSRALCTLREQSVACRSGERNGGCLGLTLADGGDAGLGECEQLVGLDRLHSLHLNDSMTPLGSNRDRHALLGEGELGDRGCATFLSEPRFERLPCVLETGRDGGAPAAEDVAKAKQLRTRGKRSRSRSAG